MTLKTVIVHRGETCEVKCERCKQPFTARVADRKRGWGRFCSKSCKAIKQTRDTGISGPHYAAEGMKVKQMKRGKYAPSKVKKDTYGDWEDYVNSIHPFSSEGLGQWE